MARGRAKARGLVRSRDLKSGPRLKYDSADSSGELLGRHSEQKKAPSGTSARGGSQHNRWKTRGHVSQQTNSPAPLQAEQRSSLSDEGEFWQSVSGEDSTESGGEIGSLKGVNEVLSNICDG
jgi:hypothetical protein